MNRVLYTFVFIFCVAAAFLWATPTLADTVLDQLSAGIPGVDEDSVEGACWSLADAGFVLTGDPLDQTMGLQSVTFMKGTGWGGETAGGLYLKVFSGDTGGLGTFVGVSNNTVDVASAADGALETWTFSNLALNKSTIYSYVVGATNDSSNPDARFSMQLSPGTTDLLTTGKLLRNDAAHLADFAWDPYVSITASAIPEPATSVLLAFGLFGLLAYAWRKRKQS